MKRIFLVSVTLLLLVNVNGYAQTKIGYVSPDDIFALMPEVAKADSALAVLQKELSKTYQDEQNSVNEAYNKFVKDSVTMTAALKDIKRKDLQSRVTGLGSKEQQLNQVLNDEKEKLLAPIREKLSKAIKDVAKESGYAHVFFKSQAIIFPESDDLDALVKKKLGIK